MYTIYECYKSLCCYTGNNRTPYMIMDVEKWRRCPSMVFMKTSMFVDYKFKNIKLKIVDSHLLEEERKNV